MAEIIAACTVYGTGDRLIIQTRGWDEEAWAWVGILTIDVRDAGASPAELGQALIDALAASGPVPPDATGGASGRLLFEVAGVESHVELGRLAKSSRWSRRTMAT